MLQLRSSARRVARTAGAPSVVFIGTFAFRWLSMGALENDHFVALARAHQILHGDWPVRDFVDPGQPLTYLTSAAAARLFGATLLTDAALATALLSLGAALTYSLARRASGSVLIAMAAVAVELAAAPRLYNAGKIVIPLAAIGLGWRYADAPSRPRLAALAAWTAVAFLWRHDFMVYAAVPTLVMLALDRQRQRAMRNAGFYAAITIGVLLPWLIYVQWAGGLADYAAAAFGFASTEARRTVDWPGDAWATLAIVMAIPAIAVGMARRAEGRAWFPHIVFAAAMACMLNLVLLRDVIATRLPDVIGVTALLAAWIVARLVPRPWLNATAAAALVVVGALVAIRLASQGFGLPTPAQAVRRLAVVSATLKASAPDAVPNQERLPLIRYLATCTPPSARVLVSGFGPEIPVLAHRPFAAGLPSFIPGYNTAAADVRRAAARLAREPVSMAILLEGSHAFAEGWPALAANLRARGFVERTWRLDRGDVVVWVPADVAEHAPDEPPSCNAP